MNVVEKIEQVRVQQSPVLDLSDCGLLTVPESVFDLTHLKVLILGKKYVSGESENQRNRLIFISSQLAQLTALEGLGLAGNAFESFPEVVTELPQLRTLILSQNNLRQLPSSIGQLTQLEELIIENNQLTVLPEELNRCRQLKRLGAANNQLYYIPSQFSALTLLEQIGLANNVFQTFPEVFLRLPRLQIIGLGRNQIKSLPAQLSLHPALMRLQLEGNPLPENIIAAAAKGSKYLHRLAYEEKKRQHSRVEYIINSKPEYTAEELERIYKKNTTRPPKQRAVICAVCMDKKLVNGYNEPLRTHFRNQKCYGCNGEGKVADWAEEIHEALSMCRRYKEAQRLALQRAVTDFNFNKKNLTTATAAELVKKENLVHEVLQQFELLEKVERSLHNFLWQLQQLFLQPEKIAHRAFPEGFERIYAAANSTIVVVQQVIRNIEELGRLQDAPLEREIVRDRLNELERDAEALLQK